jgi:hypothetical protein
LHELNLWLQLGLRFAFLLQFGFVLRRKLRFGLSSWLDSRCWFRLWLGAQDGRRQDWLRRED